MNQCCSLETVWNFCLLYCNVTPVLILNVVFENRVCFFVCYWPFPCLLPSRSLLERIELDIHNVLMGLCCVLLLIVRQCNGKGESIKKVGIHELAPQVSCPSFLSTLHAPSQKTSQFLKTFVLRNLLVGGL